MMRPLKELTEQVSPIEAEGIDLLRAAPGHQPQPGQKDRVRARLLQHPIGRRLALFRPAVIVPIVLCAAVASAAAGRSWIAHTVQTLVATTVTEPVGAPPAHGPARRTRTSPTARGQATGTTAPAERAPAVDQQMPAASRQAPAARAGSAASGTSGKTGPGSNAGATRARRSSVSRQAGEDTTLVFDAMRALRQDDQPARAASLLDDYLRRYPAGAQAEEALALSIEAAVARRDPRASALVTTYLNRYPIGHFRAVVESANRRRLIP